MNNDPVDDDAGERLRPEQLLKEYATIHGLDLRVDPFSGGEAFLAEHPYLKMAQGETDTGVIISYNAVDERAERKGPRDCAINPLNWKTDGTPAGKEENLGFAVINTYGEITQEIPAYCGAYLEADSGKLIVTDAANQDELYAAVQGSYRGGRNDRSVPSEFRPDSGKPDQNGVLQLCEVTAANGVHQSVKKRG